jgi:hypothetical protein
MHCGSFNLQKVFGIEKISDGLNNPAATASDLSGAAQRYFVSAGPITASETPQSKIAAGFLSNKENHLLSKWKI